MLSLYGSLPSQSAYSRPPCSLMFVFVVEHDYFSFASLRLRAFISSSASALYPRIAITQRSFDRLN